MKSGRVRALAVASAKPSALVPGLPTVAAAGMAGYQADTPLGVFMPAGAAPSVIERFNQALAGVLNTADVKKLVTAQGSEVVASSPAEFAATLRSEIARWSKLIKTKGLRED
jgi:tripartite-type tricarboxylate transporter receptor subunit TctC